MITPTIKDIRAARSYLGWTQEALAKKCSLSVVSINQIEKGKQIPSKKVLDDIHKTFYDESIIFIENGGFRIDNNPVRILTGKNACIVLQKNIIKTMEHQIKGEVLYLGANDKRASKEIIENEAKMHKMRIPYKKIIAENNNYILGNLKYYRQVDSKFLSNDVTVIYHNKIAFGIHYNTEKYKIVILEDKELSSSYKEYFNKLWNSGIQPTISTAKK